jgi:hypothetical protein
MDDRLSICAAEAAKTAMQAQELGKIGSCFAL